MVVTDHLILVLPALNARFKALQVYFEQPVFSNDLLPNEIHIAFSGFASEDGSRRSVHHRLNRQLVIDALDDALAASTCSGKR